MVKHTKLISSFVIIIVLALGLFYFLQTSHPTNRDLVVKEITPEGYPDGTKISVYKSTPPDFPQEVILEQKMLTYSGTLTNKEGVKQIRVSYISDQKVPELASLYLKSFPGNGFNASYKSIEKSLAIIRGYKDKHTITITMAPLENNKTNVTFQYE